MDTSFGKGLIIVHNADTWISFGQYQYKVRRAVLMHRIGFLPLATSPARLSKVTDGDVQQYLYYIHMPLTRRQRLQAEWSSVLMGSRVFNDKAIYEELEEFIEFSLDRIYMEEWEVAMECPRVLNILRCKLDAGTLLMLYEPENSVLSSFLGTVAKRHHHQILEYTERIHALEQRLRAAALPLPVASCESCSSERALCAPLHTCVPCGYRYTHEAQKCACPLQEFYTLPVNNSNDTNDDIEFNDSNDSNDSNEQQRKAIANTGDMLTDEQKDELL